MKTKIYCLSVLGVIAVITVMQDAQAVAACIPTTVNGNPTPVMGSSMQQGGGSNGNVIVNNGTTNTTVKIPATANSTIQSSGTITTFAPVLPALVPAIFPTSPNNTTPPANNIPAGNYATINLTAATTFTGGTTVAGVTTPGTTYIDTLTTSGNGVVTLGSGTYFIKNLSLGANLNIAAGATVVINIGSIFSVTTTNVLVNSGGSVASLQVNFYPSAVMDTQNKTGFSLTGLLYAPSTNTIIDFANGTLIGAAIGGGTVKLGGTTVVYGPTQQTQVAQMSTTCTGGGGSAAGSFNAFETTTAANSTTGLIYTKLAGTSFGFDVVAIQTNGTSLATNFAGTVQLELVNAAAATGTACTGAVLIQALGNATFTAGGTGRITAPAVTVPGTWPNVRVRMTYAGVTPSVVSCSTDNFAIRPAALTLSTTTAMTAPPTSTIKVGAGFNVAATSPSGGYTGTPAAVPANIVDENNAVITAVNLTGAFAAATGTVATGTFQYNELGNITLNTDAVQDTTFTASDQASGGCVLGSTSNALVSGKYGCNIGSTALGPLGRFIPDHFDTIVTQGCNSTGTAAQLFTYAGQPFTVTLTARGAATSSPANKQMAKYAGTYAQNTSLSTVPAGGTLSILQALSTSFASGVAAVSPSFVPATTPSAPNAITIRATDADGVTSLGSAVEGAVNVRAGRFSVSNAVGSDLYPLSVPFALQYYSATGWITNPDDTCTAVPATTAFGLGNYKGGLTSTSVTAVTLPASNGAGVITLAKPATKLTSSGSVTVTPPTTPAWLQPAVPGVATFSIFNGAKEFIYMRETY